MIEDEAKTKWCPFYRQSPQSAIDNRSSNHPNADNWNCIASDCMMWRAIIKERSTYPTGGIQSTSAIEVTETIEIGGYCGLAGKPQ